MFKLISQLISIFVLGLVASSSLQVSKRSHSAVSSVINNDSMLKVLLEHIDRDIKLRILSKNFMKVFDELCIEQLLLLDPRIKSLTHSETGQAFLSPLGVFLPKSVPILKLYTSYLSCVDPLCKKNFDEKFPVLKIPENVITETRQKQMNIDYNRFMEMLRFAIQIEFNSLPNYIPHPFKLYGLYRLLVVTFSECSFINEIAKPIGFPLNKLLSHAASGRLPIHYCVELLSQISINSEPHLLFEAIDSCNSDLVKAILDNPQNNLVFLMYQRSMDFSSPMHRSAFQGNISIINLLLERRFPVKIDDARRTRPIHVAAMFGNFDAVVRFFEFDNDVFFSPLNDIDRPAPIVEAALHGHIRIVKFFLEKATFELIFTFKTSRLLVEAALQRKDSELGNLLIDSKKLMLESDDIESLKLLNFDFNK